MVKMKLTEPHYLAEQYLPAGTIVDIHPSAMSISMEGLDDEGQALADKHQSEALGIVGDHGTGGVNRQSLPNHPITVSRADGTFGEHPIMEKANKEEREAKEVPQTTVQPPKKPEVMSSDKDKPVFPNSKK